MREIRERKLEDRVRDLLCLNAPVITGLKPSAIINVSQSEYLAMHRLFKGSDISIFPLFFDKRMTLIMYRECDLRDVLSCTRVMELMQSIDNSYTGLCMRDLLLHFRRRFRSYKSGKLSFPHEIGLMLGYPVEDVVGFIKHQGYSALATGYWKVYHDLPSALMTFRAYDISIQSFRMLLSYGAPLSEIISIYSARSVPSLMGANLAS